MQRVLDADVGVSTDLDVDGLARRSRQIDRG